MSQSLAIKYRPHDFASVCSQEAVIKILRRQLELQEFKNCYLFAGFTGCGKTTLARIFANYINDGQGEPIEIDAASNNGVDNVREIIDSAYERSFDSEYKIYIIDECHMLSNSAWNALLKVIEEPPQYTIFMFCTTDVQKVPSTILNRVMRFNLTRIKSDVIIKRLEYICQQEHFTNYEETIDYISKIADGSMRTAINYLDKVAAYDTNLTIDNALQALGNYSYEVFFKLINFIIDNQQSDILQIIADMYNNGSDMKMFIENFFNFCVDVWKYSIFRRTDMITIPASMKESLENSVNFKDSSKFYDYYVDRLLSLKTELKFETNARSVIEVVLLQMAALEGMHK